MAADPNTFDYFRRGEPLGALRGANAFGFDMFRRGESPAALVLSVTVITGALAVTQGAQTTAQAGAVAVAGVLSKTQGAQTVSGAGTVLLSGSLSVTQGAQTTSAAASVLIGGVLAGSQDAQSVAQAGAVAIAAALQAAQDAHGFSGAGGVSVSGALSVTQGAQTFGGAGGALAVIVGVLNVTQGAHTVAAIGVTQLVAIPLTPQQRALLRAAQRIHNAFGFGAKQALVFDTYQIRRTATSSDGMGGTIPGTVSIVETFQGALMAQGANAQEREMIAQLTAAGGYILHAPLGADIRASDQLVSASGRTFEVRGAPLRGMPAVNLLVAVEELL